MLVVTITGTGDIEYNNASALLDDYLPEDVLVYVPSYIQSDGMRVVVQWLKDAGITIERVKKHLQFDYFLGNPDTKEKVLMVLGTEGCEEIIQECLAENILVLDLTKGLYSVDSAGTGETQIALDGSVSKSESLTDDPGTQIGSEKDLGSDLLTELAARVERIEKVLEDNGINWEHTAHPRLVSAGAPQPVEEHSGKERYYQNGKGKIRKAGRSKIKPGEKEVWLTDEEVAAMD